MIFSRPLPRSLSRHSFTFALAALGLLLAPLAAHAAARAKPTRPAEVENSAAFKGAIAIDAATGQVLLEDRADYSGPMASMTKLMTFAVLQDKLDKGTLKLDTPVRITKEDSDERGTQVFLDARETFPVEELMYAMMIQSANDAAYALARFSAGSVSAFVEQMNAKARELGMTHTTFRTPNGYPPASRKLAEADTTTPRDYAILSRHLVLNTSVLKYSSIRNRDFAPERPQGVFKMVNHNSLLGRADGVDGLKTGYTEAAGYCTSVTALRNNHRVIVVIMGSLGPGGQIDKGKLRDLKAIEWLNKAFAAIPATSPAFVPKSPAAIPVISASKPEPTKAPDDPLSIKVNIPKKK